LSVHADAACVVNPREQHADPALGEAAVDGLARSPPPPVVVHDQVAAGDKPRVKADELVLRRSNQSVSSRRMAIASGAWAGIVSSTSPG
jgi:hypothetical protein